MDCDRVHMKKQIENVRDHAVKNRPKPWENNSHGHGQGEKMKINGL